MEWGGVSSSAEKRSVRIALLPRRGEGSGVTAPGEAQCIYTFCTTPPSYNHLQS